MAICQNSVLALALRSAFIAIPLLVFGVLVLFSRKRLFFDSGDYKIYSNALKQGY